MIILTPQEKIELAKIKFPQLLFGEYNAQKRKIGVSCKICNNQFDVFLDSFAKRQTACSFCKSPKLLTNEKFLSRLSEVNSMVIPLDTYVDSKTSIKCKCKVDGYEWNTTPARLISGQGCPLCSRQVGISVEEMNSILIRKAFKIRSISVNPISAIKQSEFECLICGHKWFENFYNVRKRTKYDCPRCYIVNVFQNEQLKHPEISCLSPVTTHEEYLKALAIVHSRLHPIDNFSALKTDIKHVCHVHSVETMCNPLEALLGRGCSECKKEKVSKRTQRDPKEYPLILQREFPLVEALDAYVRNNVLIRHRCKKCGHIWKAKPNTILCGSGCPRCASSKGEKRIAEVLSNYGIEFVSEFRFNDCRNSLPLPFDFYIPKRNMLIEYQGKQHYEVVRFRGASKEVSQKNYSDLIKRDGIKRNYCKANMIHLIEIPYWDFDNIESILLSELHIAS